MMKFINYCTVKLEILKTGQIIISSNSRDTHTRILQIYARLQVFLQVFFWLTQQVFLQVSFWLTQLQKLTLLIWTVTFHNFGSTAHSSWCARSAYINSFIIHSYWPAFFPSCLGRITTFKIRYNNFFFASLFRLILVDEPLWWLVYTIKATEVIKWVNITRWWRHNNFHVSWLDSAKHKWSE
jgi:hypothetical protein